MNWFIKLKNGKELIGNKNEIKKNFNDENVDKIFFRIENNEYGFYRENGNFFINDNIVYYQNLNNPYLDIFQYKTAVMVLGSSEPDILCFNIGYKFNDIKYTFKIYKKEKILFIEDEISNKSMRLNVEV